MQPNERLKLRRPLLVAMWLGFALFAVVGLTWISFAAPLGSASPAPAAPEGNSTLGDYVWFDLNSDGQHLGAEAEYLAGVDGVRVNLYKDANANDLIDPGEFDKSMVTGDNPNTPGATETGWYDFSGVVGLTQYIVEIAPSNFLPGGRLHGYVLSSENTWGPNPMVVYLANSPDDYNAADFGFIRNPVQVTKTLVSTSPYAAVGDTVTFRITVTNTGQTTLDPVPLDDYYGPACLKFVAAYVDVPVSASYPPNVTDFALGWLHWNNIGPLGPGASKNIFVQFTAQQTQEMYSKEGNWQDYAPKGMPDFSQKQGGWDSPQDSGTGWYRCGPVAAANSLWWFDSKFEAIPAPPAMISDTYPLVPSFGPPGAWDDHDPHNVEPLVNALAVQMGTSPLAGTSVSGLATGIASYITSTVGPGQYSVTVQARPPFSWVAGEVRRSEDVLLLLGFWQFHDISGQQVPFRIGGHYVTVAGANVMTPTIVFSDPYSDTAEFGQMGRVIPNPHLTLHASQAPTHDTVHNDASLLSHDAYTVTATSTHGDTWGPWQYIRKCAEANAFKGQNVGDFPNNSLLTCDDALPVFAEVEYAVAVSPNSNTVMCSPTTNIAVVAGATTPGTGFVWPAVQSEAAVTEGADWGDLPDPGYPTLLINNGPRHLITSPLRLGVMIDAELNGQPNATATGDDTNGIIPDDEDGVTSQPGLSGTWADGTVAAGKGGSLEIVISGGSGVPQVFIDFTGGGLVAITLRSATNLVLPTTPWLPGTYRVYFDIPANTMAGGANIPVRVRLSNAGGLAATGAAPDGEVEDYIFNFTATAVSVASFSAGPGANLLLIGLGGAGFASVLAVWGARRRRRAAAQQP